MAKGVDEAPPVRWLSAHAADRLDPFKGSLHMGVSIQIGHFVGDMVIRFWGTPPILLDNMCSLKFPFEQTQDI